MFQLSYKKKLTLLATGWIVFTLVTTLLSSTSIKFPNDGVYYFSLAQSLLNNGTLQDITTIPPRAVATSQNGIVFVIAFLYKFFNSFWLIPFALIVSVLWIMAIIQIYSLLRSLRLEKIAASIITMVLTLQLEILICNISFYNESLYLPCFYGCLSYGIRHYMLEEKKTSKWGPLFLFSFLVLGMLFRLQHVILLVTLLIYTFFIEKRWRWQASLVTLLSGAVFLLGSLSSVWGVRTNIISENWDKIFSFDPCRVVYLLSQFSFFLFSDKFFSPCSKYVMLLGIIGAFLFLWVFIKFYSSWRKAFLFAIIYITLNAAFLYLLPWPDNRYALTQRLMIAVVLSTLFSARLPDYLRVSREISPDNRGNNPLRKVRWLTLSVIILITLSCAGIIVSTYKYLSSQSGFFPTQSRVFTQLRSHDLFKEKIPVDDYLIYSITPHLTYWRLNKSVCESPPELCAFSANQPFSNKIYFFGKAEDFPSGMLKGYKLDKALTPLLDGFAFWNVIPL